MKNQELIEKMLPLVGGVENIEDVYHCATRLRFVLKDEGKFQQEKLQKIQGIIGVVQANGESQIIIGPNVSSVYTEMRSHYLQDLKSSGEKKKEDSGKNIFSKMIDTMIGIFAPLVPALTGTGMVKAVLAILVLFGMSKESQNYYILNMISDSIYYFLPILLAASAANRFKVNQYLAIGVAGVLLHPNFTALVAEGNPVKFFGAPVTLFNYASTAVPIILVVWFMSFVEPLAEKYSPSIIKVLLKPLIIILVTAPVALIVIGPIGSFLGNILSVGINFLDKNLGFLVPTIMGAFTPLLVAVGMHVSLTPLVQLSLATKHYERITGPGMLASNIAQGGASLAVALKSKNKETKQLATSAGITALCGITEPALYGVTMAKKRPLIAVMIAGGVGGFYAGVSGLVRYSFGSPGFPTLPVFIGEDPKNIIHALITLAIAFVLSFVLTWIIGFEDDVEDSETTSSTKPVDNEGKPVEIASPLKGSVMPLSAVKDETFASEALGKGIAIMPESGLLVSPVNGEVEMVFKTKHAIGLKSNDGAEILIHIGLDTVKLQGEYFTSLVEQGDKVVIGQELIRFDQDKIQEAGYDLATSIVITNTNQYLDVLATEETAIETKEKLLTLV